MPDQYPQTSPRQHRVTALKVFGHGELQYNELALRYSLEVRDRTVHRGVLAATALRD